MPREASGRVRLEIDLQERNTGQGSGGNTASMPHQAIIDLSLPNGTSDGQIDRVHSEPLSLTTTPTDFDLAGSLQSDIGAGVTTFAEVSGLLVQNTSEVGDIIVGGDTNFFAALGAAAHTIAVKPGGCLFLSAPKGYTVTAGTGDILQLAASAGVVTGKLIVYGRSA